MRRQKVKINANDLEDLDHIISRVYETEYIDPADETEEQTKARLEADKKAGAQIVSIDIDMYVYPKLRRLLDYLYQERLLIRYKEADIVYSKEHNFLGVDVLRPFNAEKEYSGYFYASLFNFAKYDIDQVKRLFLIIDEIHAFPCTVSELFRYTDIKPSIDNLGAKSLADFEKKLKDDLQLLLDEKIISSLQVDGDYVDLDYMDCAIRRLRMSLELYLQEQKQEEISPTQSEYKITFTKDRQILLNNQFLISKPNSFGENDEVFNFLYNNPNKPFSKEDIKEQAGIVVSKSFDKIVENLNFKNDLRKVFFKVSKTHILFRNPVSKQQIDEMGIRYIKL